MPSRVHIDILPQPDDSTCGPTCLHAVYRYYGDNIRLGDLIRQVPALDEGGTLAVFLGCHALERGYRATIYTYNLQVFDPTWFDEDGEPINLRENLTAQRDAKKSSKLRTATAGYLRFLELGGRIVIEDLTTQLIRRYLNRNVPILTGLSATFLHRSVREYGPRNDEDSIRGEPTGHFVVLCGYEPKQREVLVADPMVPNPFTEKTIYAVTIDRVVCAILLGVVTYDANMLIIERPKKKSAS